LGKSLGEGIRGFREATGESRNQSATNSSAEVSTATTQTTQLTAEEQQQFQEWQEFKKWQASKANSEDQT
jgi:Sec-independent protein translocase protein TatA